MTDRRPAFRTTRRSSKPIWARATRQRPECHRRPPVLLEVSNRDVRYGRTHAVKNVSLTVHEGEIVTVLGANGAGKTSLLRALQGAVRSAASRIVFNGKDLTGTSPAARVRSGMMLVPEGRQIFVSMTVHENLQMGVYLRRDREVARDLDAVYDRFPNL